MNKVMETGWAQIWVCMASLQAKMLSYTSPQPSASTPVNGNSNGISYQNWERLDEKNFKHYKHLVSVNLNVVSNRKPTSMKKRW